ncbi:MAG: hypothetical protein IJD79_06550 [Clostridia bacterium]|nr:hypothetical protein [Clostridia bacterium]
MAERIYTRRDRVTNKALSDLAVALCADFERRQRAIIEKSASRRVTMEYSYINTRMLLAASEIVGLGDAERFIYEIGHGVGYAQSEIAYRSESNYKVMKMRVKANILRRLHLCD